METVWDYDNLNRTPVDLESTGWQKKKASAILGINASTLYRKIQRYGLEPQREMAQVD